MGKIVLVSTKGPDSSLPTFIFAYDGNMAYEYSRGSREKQPVRVANPEIWLQEKLSLLARGKEQMHRVYGLRDYGTELREAPFSLSLYQQLIRDLF